MPDLSTATNPNRSPSYPRRVHVREKERWEALVRTWDRRVEAIRQELAAGTPTAIQQRFLAQLLGARDELAQAARRLPGEVGELYSEDHHRLEQAVAALERLTNQWKVADEAV